MAGRRSVPYLVAALAACLALALGGQAMADAIVADASGADTTRAVGRAANSYLTGLRTFAAAALWNRLDPVSHNYYQGVGLDSQHYMLTTIAIVQMLDPRAVQSYYVGSWILAQNDRLDEGMDMARRGVEANPRSGILLTGYAQLLSIRSDDRELTLSMAERAMAPDLDWTDPIEQVNAYAALGGIFRQYGRGDLDTRIQAMILEVESTIDPSMLPEGHDHDGDGTPDH